MSGMADPIPLPELIAKLGELDGLTGIEKVRAARALDNIARATIAAAGHQGVYEATREFPYEEVRQRLQYSTLGPVRRAVTAHLRNLKRRLT